MSGSERSGDLNMESPRAASQSPNRKDEDERRSRSRSRSKSRGRSRSPARRASRSRSRTPPRDTRDRRSRSPARGGRSRSRSPARGGTWKEKLDRLFDKGYLRRDEVDEALLDDIEKFVLVHKLAKPAKDASPLVVHSEHMFAAEMRDDEADCVVQRMTEADFGRVRSINGFISGIIKRVKLDGPDTNGGGNIDMLSRSVRRRLEDLIEDRKIERQEVDQRMVRALADLPTHLGEEAVSRYGRSIDGHVRNRQGFMMGIIKKVVEEDRFGGRGGGGYGGGGYGGGGYGGGGYGGGGYGGGGYSGGGYSGSGYGSSSYGGGYGGGYGSGRDYAGSRDRYYDDRGRDYDRRRY